MMRRATAGKMIEIRVGCGRRRRRHRRCPRYFVTGRGATTGVTDVAASFVVFVVDSIDIVSDAVFLASGVSAFFAAVAKLVFSVFQILHAIS